MAVVHDLEGALVARGRERGEASVVEPSGAEAEEGCSDCSRSHLVTYLPTLAHRQGLATCQTSWCPFRRASDPHATICSAPASTVTRTSSSSATWSPSTCHGRGRPSPERIRTSWAPS